MARFYISSTFTDLKDCREAVYRTLRRLGHEAIAMEDYVAADERPTDKCISDVQRCDVYVGIFAWRRGYIPEVDNPKALSITELEYQCASERGMPRLIYLLSPAAPWPIDWRDAETNDQCRTIQQLRTELKQTHVVSDFETSTQLALLVSISVRKWEIDTGYRHPSPALADQNLPEELRVARYVPGRSLELTGRLPLPSRLFQWLFFIVWFGVIILAISSSLHNLEILIGGALMLIPGSLTLFHAWRGPRLKFDLKTQKVSVTALGSWSRGGVAANSIVLKTELRVNRWSATLSYGSIELARTEKFHSRDLARQRLLHFAEALNQSMGLLSLSE